MWMDTWGHISQHVEDELIDVAERERIILSELEEKMDNVGENNEIFMRGMSYKITHPMVIIGLNRVNHSNM